MRQLSVENKTISIVCMHKELKINLKFDQISHFAKTFAL